MAEFGTASIWMKLVMMLISAAFSLHLFSMDTAGWNSYQVQACATGSVVGVCYPNDSAVRAVQALEVIGFLCVLISLFLALCLVLLHELKGNKMALIMLCIFSLISGMAIICGIGVYEGTTNAYANGNYKYADGSEFASTIGVTAGICALLGGMFCIFELCGCSIK